MEAVRDRYQAGPARWLAACLLAAVVVALPAPAQASKEARGKDAKAIKKAFTKARDGDATVTGVRISTEDDAFAAVSYEIVVPSPPGEARLSAATAAPIPVLLQEKKPGKWKPVTKAPSKVKKDLKAKGKTDIKITGDVVAFLKDLGACSVSSGFYSAGVYDKLGDVYLSLEFPSWNGFGPYDALGVKSVATLAVGTGATSYQYETGQGGDAFASSGSLYVDQFGWGEIDAGMAHVPDGGGTYPITVGVSGKWVCR